MGTTVLNKDDLWHMVLGGAALATGGGGAAPSYTNFSEYVDESIENNFEFKLVDPKTVPENEFVFLRAGVGGGLQRDMVEKYLRRYTSVSDWIKEMDKIFPLPSWAELPDDNWMKKPYERMVELVDTKPYAYMPFEIGPNNFREFLHAGALGIPVVDADNAGYRAVPEVSLATLNVKHAPIAPVVVSTAWGDLVVFEKFLSWQRAEDLIRHIAITSGGGCMGMLSFTGKWIKKGTVPKTLTLSMKVGEAITKARDHSENPVAAIIKAAEGYLIFEGEIAAYTNEGKGSFTWGNTWIKGTGNYQGQTLKIWYKNENQISWIDEKPHVTCPDPFTVVDTDTGEGLSNFRTTSWLQGRKVSVWGMRAASPWRTERGLKIYNPKHFGFDIPYKPIEQIIS
jgi:DUF917 family protein